MGKKEKLIAAAIAIALGILFIVLKSDIINISMTVIGVTLIIFGVIDIVKDSKVAIGIIKIVIAALLIIFGWVWTLAVLYLLGGALIIAGILLLYELLKNRVSCFNGNLAETLQYLEAIVGILIGVLLLLNGFDWIFIAVGIVTIIEGLVIFVEALKND